MSSGLVLGRRPLGAILHSSNEPGELSQWLCHDDSTINIVVLIIIIIIGCSDDYGKVKRFTTEYVRNGQNSETIRLRYVGVIFEGKKTQCFYFMDSNVLQ